MANNGIVGTYVPSALTVVISHRATNQTVVLGGFAPDTIVSIERPDPTWESNIGTHGTHERIHRMDKTIRATISLQQTSESNDFLSAILAYDEKDLRGGGLFTCTIADKSGRSAAYSDQAYVIQPSTYEFGQAASTRDWMIIMPYAEQHIGGNGRMSQESIDKLAQFGITIDQDWLIN
jgi:hypothetical protein